MASLRAGMRRDYSTYMQVLYRLDGKQSSTSFEDLASANKFQKMVDKFGPVKALETLGADPEFSADKFPSHGSFARVFGPSQLANPNLIVGLRDSSCLPQGAAWGPCRVWWLVAYVGRRGWPLSRGHQNQRPSSAAMAGVMKDRTTRVSKSSPSMMVEPIWPAMRRSLASMEPTLQNGPTNPWPKSNSPSPHQTQDNSLVKKLDSSVCKSGSFSRRQGAYFSKLVTPHTRPERSRGRSQRRDLHPPPTADALAGAGRYAVALGAIGGGDEIVFVVLFGLGRLVDHRRLGGVELQTLVPCSLSRSLELPTLLPALSAATNLRVTILPDRSLLWRPSAYPQPQWVSATSDGGVPRKPNTVRRHPSAARGIDRYVSRFDATGGGPCSGGK
jgi:hypothetical protein